jgi:hypothetical protein
MKRLVLGGDWAARRMKALRFHLIALPGRVVWHARRLIVSRNPASKKVKCLVGPESSGR